MLDATVRSHLPATKREPDVVVYLPGPPKGKGAPRAGILKANPAKGRFQDRAMAFQDTSTRSYEAEVKFAGEKAMAGRSVFAECMLRCRLTAVFAVPPSKSGRFREQALGGILRPIVKPDDDNLLKIRDALKGIVFHDDNLFVESVVRKFYGANPCWQFECWVITGLLF